jgi:hypothetical protein
MVGLLLLGVFLSAERPTPVELQIHEQEEREEGEQPVGEEASLTRSRFPATCGSDPGLRPHCGA